MSVKRFCVVRGLCDTSLYRRLGREEGSREFIELPRGAQSGSYEICVDGVTLKVPSSEAAFRIAELMRAVRC